MPTEDNLSDSQNLIHDVVKNTGPGIYRLLFRLTLREDVADDLLQDLFVKALDSGQWSSARNPHAYLRQTAMHMAFDWRKQQRRSPQTQPLSDQIDSCTESPLDKIVDRERLATVLNALEDLPAKSRDTIVMRFIEGLEYETIAEHLGKSPHQVRSLCSKGLSRLREVLRERTIEPKWKTKL
jgi:RNA polymerase sigma-70 factor (ECF subfamily)